MNSDNNRSADDLRKLFDAAVEPFEPGFSEQVLARVARLRRLRNIALTASGVLPAAILLLVTPLGDWLSRLLFSPWQAFSRQPDMSMLLVVGLASVVSMAFVNREA